MGKTFKDGNGYTKRERFTEIDNQREYVRRGKQNFNPYSTEDTAPYCPRPETKRND